MAIFKHVIRNFSGGILEDKRVQSPSHFSITKHFDTFTYPQKLVPYPQMSAAVQNKSLKIIKFLYALGPSGLYYLFGLGQDGSAHLQLYRLYIDDAGLLLATWTAATNGSSGSGAVDQNVFFYYKGFIYNYTGGNTIQRADATDVAGFNTNYQSISYTTGAGVQPVRHPSDDIAYFFGTNIVYSLNNTTWNGAVLTLPSTEQIVCAAPYGNYLAIGTVTLGNRTTQSTVYLWDRDSSLTTLTDRIDFGTGSLRYLATLNNKLIGVVNHYTSNLYSLNRGKTIIKQANGQFAVTLNTITTDSNSSTLPQTSAIEDNKLYFPMTAPLNGDDRNGIWAVDDTGKVALDTVVPTVSGDAYNGIYKAQNVWFIAHSNDGSLSISDPTPTYDTTNPSIYESLILSTVAVTSRGTVIMNAATTKKIVGTTVTTEPLLTGQSVTLKYRIDNGLSGAWTTIFTNALVGSTNHSAINIEATGANFPDYNEIQFRIESLGGAVITGMEYGAETMDKNSLY